MDRTLTWQLAIRYLRGKRTGNAVPILSRISMVAIGVCCCAMVIVFSVFNGLESTVKDLYKVFYPDVRIKVARGKFFSIDAAHLDAIKHVPGVLHSTTVIEDNALVNNNNNKGQKIIVLKGVDNSYFQVNDVKPYIDRGADTVSIGHPNTAIAGIRILNELGADVNYFDSYLELYYLNSSVKNPELDPLNAYQTLRLHPAGGFRVQDEFDSKYVLAPLPLVQELFREQGKYSSIEISVSPGAAGSVQKALQQQLGSDYKIETRYEQNRTLYMVMNMERWAIFAILLLVLLIASFNMVGALSMLVLEKQKDIAILKAMGATAQAIKKIFLAEGILWSLLGGLSGIVLGVIVCVAQQVFGFIRMGDNFMVDAFPVKISPFDLVLVIVTILVVGLLTSWYPAVRATRAIDPSLKSA